MFEDQLLSRAQLLFQQKRFKEAEKDFGQLLSQQPSSYAHSMLALCCMNLGKNPEAEQHVALSISLDPASAFAYYVGAILYFNQSKTEKSKEMIIQALALDPYDANFYGILANIYLEEKNWQLALENANEGLAIESDNIDCLNARATAFIKLDKKEAAYETIKEALYFDPENSHTHSNIGWGLIEKGDYKKSLYHFKEALSIDPNNSHARAGLVEALKAKYWFYRMFLRYAFWIGNMKTQMQWVMIIGFYIGSKVITMIGENYPALKVITVPLIVLYVLFAITTWIITPLSNLFLRLNVYGKYALDKTEIQCSNMIGISLLISVLSGIVFLFTNQPALLMLCIMSFVMMIPVSAMFAGIKRKKGVTILMIYTGGLVLAGLASVALTALGAPAFNLLFSVFIIGVVAYQWIANAIFTK